MERFVPESRTDWRLSLWRAWLVVGGLFALLWLSTGMSVLGVMTWCAGWFIAGKVIGWIFAPALAPRE